MKTAKNTDLPPAMALARSLFRAQKGAPKVGTYQDEKEKWQAHARRTLRVLENHGYALTKINN